MRLHVKVRAQVRARVRGRVRSRVVGITRLKGGGQWRVSARGDQRARIFPHLEGGAFIQ